MSFDLPPLKALPAFEAAGRLLSFTRAAEELNMTQAGISFQVRNLEQSLGVRLFERNHRSLKLTAEGEILLKAVQGGLQTIASGKREITRTGDTNVVKITAPVSFSSKWLVRRIGHLRESYPSLRIQIEADDRMRDLDADGIDIAVRYLRIGDAAIEAEKLMDDTVIPVCSPLMANIDKTADLAAIIGDMTLLSDVMADVSWKKLLKELGLPEGMASNETRFSHTVHSVDAALSGAGLALGRLPLVADDLTLGQLINPLKVQAPSKYAYFLLVSATSKRSKNVKRVSDWLRAQASQTMLVADPANDARNQSAG